MRQCFFKIYFLIYNEKIINTSTSLLVLDVQTQETSGIPLKNKVFGGGEYPGKGIPDQGNAPRENNFRLGMASIQPFCTKSTYGLVIPHPSKTNHKQKTHTRARTFADT